MPDETIIAIKVEIKQVGGFWEGEVTNMAEPNRIKVTDRHRSRTKVAAKCLQLMQAMNEEHLRKL